MLLCMFSESTIWPSILMNSFFNAQFNYCPLRRMLHSRRNNNIIKNLHERCLRLIKNLHERCLRLIYNDKNLSYERFLTKYDSVSIHHRNIHALATELFEIKNGFLPDLNTEIFTRETVSL